MIYLSVSTTGETIAYDLQSESEEAAYFFRTLADVADDKFALELSEYLSDGECERVSSFLETLAVSLREASHADPS